MLPTSSAFAASVQPVVTAVPCTPTRPRTVLAMVPTGVLMMVVVLMLLPLPGAVLGDYENTWNSYYEQPCCGGTTNGPFHLRHHGEAFHSIAIDDPEGARYKIVRHFRDSAAGLERSRAYEANTKQKR
uniref:Uncharacterized protein n=1 Tax=Anopheles christyi TaxID=43041 RepID=A0A182K7W7_9DIPT